MNVQRIFTLVSQRITVSLGPRCSCPSHTLIVLVPPLFSNIAPQATVLVKRSKKATVQWVKTKQQTNTISNKL